MYEGTNALNGYTPNKSVQPQIIITDDDPSVRFLLKHILEKEHFHTLEACNGHEAIKLLESHTVDMLLIDAVMPELNGFETCKIVKQKFPELPVIIITSLDDDASVEEAYISGADDYITKPINWSVLKHRVSRAKSNRTECTVKTTPELANAIESRQYTINNRFRIDIDDNSIKSIISYHNQIAHKARRLVDTGIALQLQHSRQLIEDSFNELEKHNIVERVSIYIHPFHANPVQYINMLRDVIKSRNLKEENVECIFAESLLCNMDMIHLYNALAELNVKLHINKFSFSLHALDIAQNCRCDAIEIDIPLTYKTLGSEKIAKNMLSAYKSLNIDVYGADITSPIELEYSKEIGCSEVHGPGLENTST